MTFRTVISGENVSVPEDLPGLYDRAVPRYTSYPPVPAWTSRFGGREFKEALFSAEEPFSLYIHIPFCESRCAFCACQTIATRRRDVAFEYVSALKKEISDLSRVIGPGRSVSQIHFGGGTPTYLTPSQLEDVHSSISSNFKIQGDAVVGIEADPRVTTGEHLRALGGIGFNRLSLGVQDFSLQVQKAIGRIETADVVADMVRKAGAVGFKSINVDLVYGLPLQTLDSFMRTLGEVVSFSPDRIACFNFAYLPRIVPSQSVILKKDLPNREKKFEILCSAISFLSEHGYEFIGIDHFARQEDELCRAQKEKRLWRNFQGYTPKREGATLGLGMSAISEAGDCYAQNSKKLIEYYRGVAALELAKTRGWRLTSDDKARKKVIQDLFCSYCADLSDISFDPDILSGFEKTGLLQINGKKIEVTKLGRLFIRNIASMFDVYTQAKEGYLSRGV